MIASCVIHVNKRQDSQKNQPCKMTLNETKPNSNLITVLLREDEKNKGPLSFIIEAIFILAPPLFIFKEKKHIKASLFIFRDH